MSNVYVLILLYPVLSLSDRNIPLHLSSLLDFIVLLINLVFSLGGVQLCYRSASRLENIF